MSRTVRTAGRSLAAAVLLLSLQTVFAAQSTNYKTPSDAQGASGGDGAKSTNYMLKDTIGEQGIGYTASSNYLLNAGYRQAGDATISISGPSTIDIGTITGNGQKTGSGTWTVITDADAGYSLSWTASTATMVSGADTIAAYTPAVANTPETWSVAASASEWGGRLRSSSTDTASEWGTDASSDKWLNIATSARTIVTRASRTSVSGSSEIVQFRVEIGASALAPTGTYTVTVTMTAVSL